MAPRSEKYLRPETPTRALLRRVQRRSSAGGKGLPPPLPTASAASKRNLPSGLHKEINSEVDGHNAEEDDDDEDDLHNGEEGFGSELNDQIKEDVHQKSSLNDIKADHLEAQLREVSLTSRLIDKSPRSSAPANGSSTTGLTRSAALKLEREFASQERILQGLQKDNEAKTTEVERLRRENKTMSEHLARQYGAEDWEQIVYGATSSSYAKRDKGLEAAKGSGIDTIEGSPKRLHVHILQPKNGQGSKISPLGRMARLSEVTVADSSFYSADESMAEMTAPISSSPVPSTVNMDLAAILSLIEAQKLLIKGFERSNALKMVECQSKIDIAKEREGSWRQKASAYSL